MAMEVKVISNEIDGFELRREKRSNPYHTKCTGKGDEMVIEDALHRATGEPNSLWSIPARAWDRIFGGK